MSNRRFCLHSLVLLAGVSALGAPPSLAQTDAASSDAETLLITGARLAAPAAERGSSVSIITAEDIALRGLTLVVDALAMAPGVTVNQNGPFGGAATVRIRGASSEQTLVLIDGAPVNDPTSPGGGFDFSTLDTADIERVEILKGAHSTLWGTDAIGGVVNVVTRAPRPGLTGSLLAEAGAFDSRRGGASVGYSGARGSVRAAVTAFSTDGISKADAQLGNTETDPFDTVALSVRGALNLPGAARLEATARQVEAQTAFDAFDFSAPGFVSDGDESSETLERSATVRLLAPAFDGRIVNTVSAAFAEIERDNFSNGAPSFSADGRRTVLRYQGDLVLSERQRSAFGVEREDTRSGSDERGIDSLFALYEARPTRALVLTAGARRDNASDAPGETTARVAAAWQASDAWTVSASWGQGFKTPTVFQRTFFCCGAAAANPDLRAETSEGFDLGLSWNHARLDASVTYFAQEVEDLITFSFADGGYSNIARAETSGVEAAAELVLSPNMTARLAYTSLDAQDDVGARLIRTPEHTADLSFSYTPGAPWRATASVRHNGEERDSQGQIDAWTRLDVNVGYQLTPAAELTLRVENLLDTAYQQVLGYGTPGRAATLGVQVRF